ncbi:MAG: 4-(cytidine 5'-diphospho)-2-C-methyl-D-erythritol kinase [Mycoplasmoidaceae bacterium]
MKLKAYPKVNLCLKVYKGLSEGKHRIDSVMLLYKKIHDSIYINKSDRLYVFYKDNGKQVSIPDCLVTKALRYLHNQHDVDVNYKIWIIKKIPYAAGVGGASADAAAVMNYVLKHNPSIQLNLKEVALELGSDIPFFLSKYKIARVREHGEFVSPIYDWDPKVQLHFNGIIASTTKVYASLNNDPDYESRVNVDKIIENHLYKQHSINVVYNDLTKYIIQNYKELQELYKKYPNKSFFTGTGSTIVTLKE